MQRLRDRKLAQWTLGYAAAAWVALQVLGFLADNFTWSPLVVRAATVIAAGGLLGVLVLAWYHGEQGRQRVSAAELVLLGTLLLATSGAVAIIARPGAELRGQADAVPADLDARRVAVLPFRNANPADSGSALLALGMHDDLLNRIARIRSLRTVSRTSVEEYRETDKRMNEIAAELGAGAILEGSVQRVGARVRINVQLVDGATDDHLWVQTYDRDWSLDNLFAIQAEIAEDVASALSAALSSAESASIAERPTNDEEAYRLYTRAAELFTRGNDATVTREVRALLEAAVARDPDFARGWAFLGQLHVWTHWIRDDHTPQRLAAARRAIDRALALDPDLPEARIARGFYRYWGFLDYDGARREFEAALAAAPASTEALEGLAAVHRRRGRVQDALALYRRAATADPRNAILRTDVAMTTALLGRFDEALAHLEHSRALAADIAGRGDAALVRWAAGDLDGMERALEDAVRATGGSQSLRVHQLTLLRARGDYRAALELLRQFPEDVIEFFSIDLVVRDRLAGDLFLRLGQNDSARIRLDRAAAVLEQRTAADGEDEVAWSQLGLVYAGLGRRDDAVRAAERGAALVPIAREAWNGALRSRQLAEVHAAVGDPERALDLLEDLVARPLRLVVSPGTLRVDPAWERLHGHPRFLALTQRDPLVR